MNICVAYKWRFGIDNEKQKEGFNYAGYELGYG